MKIFIPTILAALSLAAPALAGDAPPRTVEIRIYHGDIDLADDQQVKALRARITQEINQACSATPALAAQSDKRDLNCVATARSAAFAELSKKRKVKLASLR